jgi:hypothetical protein
MALLKTSGEYRGYNLRDFTQEGGSYPAVLIDIQEYQGVEREWEGKVQIKNTMFFLFAYTDDNGKIILAQTSEFNISANPKSNLVKFLNKLRGKETPLDGTYDPASEIGIKVMLTIEGKTSKAGRSYGVVDSALPVKKKMESECPNFLEAEELIPDGRKTPRPTHLVIEQPKKMDKAEDSSDDGDDSPF